MADWVTISSLATAGGTAGLAVATYAAVRSANRSARVSETALQEQRRPLLMAARLADPVQKIRFREGRWVRTEGNQAAVEYEDGNVYLVIPVRNVGSGIAVLQGWDVWPDFESPLATHAPAEDFRMTIRDLFVPSGDIGLWQGALRDPSEAIHDRVCSAVIARDTFTVDLLYSDQVGEQRSVTRFSLTPIPDDRWLADVVRYWPLDGPGARPDRDG